MPRPPVALAAFLLSAGAALAQPAGGGFPAPDPAPPLPAAMDVFAPPAFGGPAGPAVAEWTRTAGRDETVVLAGPGFAGGAVFRVWGQTTAGDGVLLERAANAADGLGASVTLPAALPAGSLYLVWPGAAGAFGPPVAVNRTEAWWLGPDAATAGETVALHGRNLAHDGGTAWAWVYVKPAAGEGTWAAVVEVNPYRVAFTVPPLAPGDYQVWAHNGHGGAWGWSGPLALAVLDRSPWDRTGRPVLDVRAFGAAGDGAADDTAAIRAALAAAAAQAPATLRFPAGTYLVNGGLAAADGVSWAGEGRGVSILRAGPGFFAAGAPALVGGRASAVEFRDLSIVGAGHLGPGDNGDRRLIALGPSEAVRFARVRLEAKQRTFADGTAYGATPVDLNGSTRLVIADSTIVGAGIFLGAAGRVTIERSTFILTDRANAAVTSWGGRRVAVTGNTIRNYDAASGRTADAGERFFVVQGHFGSASDLYVADNATADLGPPAADPDPNAGEQILFEVPDSTAAGPVAAATSDTVILAAGPLPAAGDAVVVLAGRGTGQARRVEAVAGATLTVEPPWRVVPDATSRLAFGPGVQRAVVYRNTLAGRADWRDRETASRGVELYGNVSDAVVAANAIRRVRRGIGVWALGGGGVAPALFNLISGNRIEDALDGLYLRSPHYGAPDRSGLVGHFGNVFRRNALSGIVQHAVSLGSREPSGRVEPVSGRDFVHQVIEHNRAAFGPWQPRSGGLPVDVPAGLNAAGAGPGPRFGNVVVHGNVFEDEAGPAAMRIVGGDTAGFVRPRPAPSPR